MVRWKEVSATAHCSNMETVTRAADLLHEEYYEQPPFNTFQYPARHDKPAAWHCF